MKIYIRENLNMPSGKEIAQIAHAHGKAWLDRLVVESCGNSAFALRLTDKALLALNNNQHYQCPEIMHGDPAPTSCDSIITDSGRTHFSEPTRTCVAVSTELGYVQPSERLLPFDASKIDVKQGFFINRVEASKVCIDEIKSKLAVLSSLHFTSLIDRSTGVLSLSTTSELSKWLTSSFGKTVVGTKKTTKFKEVKELILDEGVKVHDLEIDGVCVAFVTEPIDSAKLQKFTRFKTFRLLD